MDGCHRAERLVSPRRYQVLWYTSRRRPEGASAHGTLETLKFLARLSHPLFFPLIPTLLGWNLGMPMVRLPIFFEKHGAVAIVNMQGVVCQSEGRTANVELQLLF